MNILIVGNIIKDIYLDFEAKLFETDRDQKKVLETTLDEESLYFKSHTTVLSGASIAEEVFQNFKIQTKLAKNEVDERYIIRNDKSVKYLTSKYARLSRFSKPEFKPDWLFIDRSARLDARTLKQILVWLKLNPDVRLAIFTGDRIEKLLACNDDLVANKILQELVQRAEILFLSGRTLDGLKLDKNIEQKLVIRITPELVTSGTLKSSDKLLNFRSNEDHIVKFDLNTKHFLTHLSIYSSVAATILAALSTGWNLERAMRFARLNLQYASLGKTLNIDQLYKKLQKDLKKENDLALLARALVTDERGVLAIDESKKTIQKKLLKLGLPDSRETSEKYREILVTTPNLSEYLNGVILSQETILQKMPTGELIPKFLSARGVLPGVKADLGLSEIPGFKNQFSTRGLVDLECRVEGYFEQGLRFTKWRTIFHPDEQGEIPDVVVEQNISDLVKYAEIVLLHNLVPIVEPEVLFDENIKISQYFSNTKKVLAAFFSKLKESGINAKNIILKINMIYDRVNLSSETAEYTMRLLLETVPTEIGGIVFLSGGQTPKQATENLREIIKLNQGRFPLSFSFGRALADPALVAWQNDDKNIQAAQDILTLRLKETCEALMRGLESKEALI